MRRAKFQKRQRLARLCLLWSLVLLLALFVALLASCGNVPDHWWDYIEDELQPNDPTPTPAPDGPVELVHHLPVFVGTQWGAELPPGIVLCTANYCTFGYNPADMYYGSLAVGKVAFTNVETGERVEIPVDAMETGNPKDLRADADNWCRKKWNWKRHRGYWYTSREENVECDRTRRGYAIAPWYAEGKYSVSIQHRVTPNRTRDGWLGATIWKDGGEHRETYWFTWNQQGNAEYLEVQVPNTEAGVEFFIPKAVADNPPE